MFFNLLPAALQYLLAWTLLKEPQSKPSSSSLTFELRHEHGLAPDSSRVVFSDIHKNSGLAPEKFTVNTSPVRIHRARYQPEFFSARMRGTQRELLWDEDEVVGPNVRDRATLQLLAKMTNNAYFDDRGKKGWYDLGPEWNSSYPFGWEPDADGFRGQIYATEDNSTVVVSIKGTSAGWLVGGGGPTVKKDKLNDNLFFSCCCARVGPTWSPVCDCYKGKGRCDQDCLGESLTNESLFYNVGTNLIYNVTYMYPDANIWLVGHSLGGGLASLLGITFGLPVVTFEALAEKLAATRLHLPLPPSTHHVTHVYHTADPIPQGACTGVTSLCANAGYALETKCHLGKVIRYDVVTKLGWSVSITTHPIETIIEKLLAEDWPDSIDGVPEYYDEGDCVDCFNWEFVNYRNTSLSSQPSRCGHGLLP